MKAKQLYKFRQAYGLGLIEGVIWDVPEAVPPSEHSYKYQLVYIIEGKRIIGYDNERGKGDHKHINNIEIPYEFIDIATLLKDFKQDLEGIENE
jgi:hypothetical protein